jgi:acyl-CoA synthetase (AMP-forming)/AMP-acid ligase II
MTDPCALDFAACLQQRAERSPERIAYIFPHGSLSYRELAQESEILARGLFQQGIRKGTRVAFLVPPSREFFTLAFALLQLGSIPILIDPGIGRRQIGRCLEQAEPEVFIGIPLAHLGRLLLGWGKRTVRLNLTVGGPRFWSGTTYCRVREAGRQGPKLAPVAMDPDEPAAVAFTSGSTGPSKGAVYTRRILGSQVELLQKHHGIMERETSLATFPLFALFDPAMGVTAVIPKMDFTRPGSVDPARILRPIREHGVTHMFGSPALLKRVALRGDFTEGKLTSLKRVLSAGAPISPKILRSFLAHLPEGALIYTPYGATEALPVATISHEEILGGTEEGTAQGAGVCVGRPFPELWVGIIRITDEPLARWTEELRLPPGQIGEIVVSGANVSRTYDRDPRGNQLAKIEGEDGTIFHRMGDVGYFDAERRLWFCGRKFHRIPTADGTLFPVACEGVFNRHPAVYRSALVGVGRGTIKEPVLCVQLEPSVGAANRAMIREELLQLGSAYPMTKGIRTLLFHRCFPVDVRHNAKIYREKLAVWAERKLQ